ncbi:MAG: FKBP-type peptidyl-prolyl cis-trans isomerase [Bacteroidia bacterium]|jgi:FKBP-type peptidyl-prolyl cis-trans isomerase FkpA|nr:FKBP-type peptidyl-prolyl cis-trans isomerase [Bacteroidota bacterium]MBP6511544.1 FKBP-type peptidyl-prolyl cis-trans isomerase [Bacteroidia bacterium]MBP7244555.1 FKBP-type peptidyl-prolyl cis-trans isomerase [Bacteroidia bacterium]
MKKISILILSFVVMGVGLLSITSCNKDGFSITSSGLRYEFIEQLEGRKPVIGDMMRMHLIYKDKNGKEIYNSAELGESFVLELTQPTFVGGLEEGFAMMAEGDSAIFLVNADSVFDKTFKQPLPANIDSQDLLRFEVRLKKVLTATEYRNESKHNTEYNQVEELRQIEMYLGDNSISVPPAKPGVYFIVFQEGKGAKPKIGDQVEIKYTGSFLGGEMFDASGNKGQNLIYRLGDGTHLIAWEEAISSMQPGGVARLILSSSNAYGTAGLDPIPPNTPIIYDIELVRCGF